MIRPAWGGTCHSVLCVWGMHGSGFLSQVSGPSVTTSQNALGTLCLYQEERVHAPHQPSGD